MVNFDQIYPVLYVLLFFASGALLKCRDNIFGVYSLRIVSYIGAPLGTTRIEASFYREPDRILPERS